MRIATLNLPKTDNQGRNLMQSVDVILTRILEAFGGFTLTEGQGAWRDPATGTIYRDPVVIVTIAANWTWQQVETLKAIAEQSARDLSQECIFMCGPTGKVEFVYPSPVRLVA